MADDVLERARQAALTIAEALPVRKARPVIEPAMSFHPTLSNTSTGYACPGNEPLRHQPYAAPPPGPQKILTAGRTRASDGRGARFDESSAVSNQETRSSPDTSVGVTEAHVPHDPPKSCTPPPSFCTPLFIPLCTVFQCKNFEVVSYVSPYMTQLYDRAGLGT